MKTSVTFVNDCANVSQTIARNLDSNMFEVMLISRTRGLWSKTLGVSWEILKSKSDIYHCAYALQDSYIVSKLRHLDFLHCHGSDVRWTIHGKWGWVVKSNLRKAKVVLYSTPDLEKDVEPYRNDAIYLPNPIELDTFYPMANLRQSEKLRAIYFVKSYEQIPPDLVTTLEKNNVELQLINGRPQAFEDMPKFLNSYNIFIDRFAIPSFSKTCLESMACGICTIDHRHIGRYEERVDELLDRKRRDKEGEENREFIAREHDASKVALKVANLYNKNLS